MANYNADIQIAVKGKSQLNQLESQLKRTQKVLNQLNKQLNFRARVQAVRLDTRQANTALRNLEQRINRLGRTINVNLRVNEKEGRRSSSGVSGAATTPVVVAARRQEAKRVDSSKSYRAMTEAQREVNRLQKEQLPFLDKSAKKQAEIAEQVQKIKKNRTEAANVERGFGTQQRLNQLNFGYDAQIRKLNRLRGEYKAVTAEARKLQAAEKAAQDQINVAAIKRDRYVNELRRRKANAIGLRNSAGAGLAGAAFQIPGLGGISAGASAGFALGGPAGAAVGAGTAALTEATAAVVAFGVEATKTAADIQKLEMALKNITGNRFADALLIIRNVVEDFNVPIAEATSQFTKLAAAADNSGVSLADTNTVYRGLAAANKALGGDSERLQGILLATSQVFSKGKVQAEELRGQIGERLPGAFGLFAKSAGMSTQELDKALEQGQVTIQDFVRFAESLLDKYEEDAAKIADAPIEAGERLKVAMDDLKLELGSDLVDIGADFQEAGIVIAEETTSWIKLFKTINKDFENFYNLIVPPTVQGFIDIGEAIKTVGAVAFEELPVIGLFINALNTAAKLKDLFLNNRPIDIVVPEYSGMEDISGDVIKPTNTGGSPDDPPKPRRSSAGAVRKSRVPELQRELALQQELLRLQGLRNQAELDSNQRELIRLETAMELAALAKKEGDIRASDVPDQEKVLQLALNQVAVARAGQAEAQQLALLERDRLKAVEDLVTAAENELALLGAETELARDLLIIEQELAALRGDKTNNFSEEDIARIKQARTNLALAKEEQRQYNELLAAAQPFADAFATGLTSGLQEVVAGTKTAEEAFADFLKNIDDLLVQTAAQMIAQYIAIGIARAFAGIPPADGKSLDTKTLTQITDYSGISAGSRVAAFAEGGRPEVGAVSVVGERGPEFFVPDQPGRIVSNKDSNAAMMRYNPANARNIEELAMTGEGGKAMSWAFDPVINVSTGNTLMFEGTNYVTQEDFQAGVSQAAVEGAKAGEARTLRRLRMSPGTRSKLGI